MTLIPVIPPEVMTPRARIYLALTAAYCFGMGASCFFEPERFSSQSFEIVKQMMPFGLATWGVLHLLVGGLAIVASYGGREHYAKAALISASALVGPWAVGFWVSYYADSNTSPTGKYAYSFIALIHVIMARQPLRSPFDPLLRMFRDG